MPAKTTRTPRGIRNNNPLNIRRSSSQWRGLVSPIRDKDFCEFETVEDGIRAALVIIRRYIEVYHLHTVRDIINRWAPSTENDTNAYIVNVCYLANLTDHQHIDFSCRRAVCQMLYAMHIVENGRTYYPLSLFLSVYDKEFS